MDRNQGYGGFFGSYNDINVPVAPHGSGSASPYLNINPAYIPNPESDFLFPEGSNHQRGRLELAFSQIGGSVFVGGAFGGMRGMYNGFLDTKQLTGAVKRTQMLNYITKQGASTAQTLGVISLLYSVLGIFISKARGAEDELNTLAAASLTGMLYKSSGGLKNVARGGAVGLGISTAYCLLTSRDKLKQMAGLD